MNTITSKKADGHNAAAKTLFDTVNIAGLPLKNRIVMAPLTRSRATRDGLVGPMVAEYYAQRADAGLIISEATNISPRAIGYAYTPGIYTDAQVQSWSLVTEAVHKKGGLIVCQLWHVGRISHPSLQPNGDLPLAPSAVKPEGQAFTYDGFVPHVTPRAIEIDEIPAIIEEYRHAAQCAKDAGFDGVEIHAANGYLLDQFLRDGTNKRQDAYGGSIENRTRLLEEVAQAVVGVWGADKVGVRLAPTSTRNDIDDSNPKPLFTHVVRQMNALGLAYIHIVEGITGGPRDVEGGFDLQATLAPLFDGVYMANNGYDKALADSVLKRGFVDVIAFGRPFISNPDLVERLRHNAALAQPDQATMYGGGAEGYIDYPVLYPTGPRAAS